MTDVTPIPTNPDTTQAPPTWGEAGGPFTVPAKVANGYGAETLPANDVNFNWQHIARWVRAMRDRTLRTDLGFMAACLLRSGDWNVGGGTLDAYLDAPAYIVLDPGDKGLAVIREFNVPLGVPITLTAERDNYVAVGLTGLAEVNAVIVDAAAPVPSVGFTNVWRLRTSATQITQANPGLPLLPQLRSFGVVGSINATEVVSAAEISAPLGTFTSIAAGTLVASGRADTLGGLHQRTHTGGGWEDAHRPTLKTFALQAVAPLGGGQVDTQITLGIADPRFFSMVSLLDNLSANVLFKVDFMITYSVDGTTPTGANPAASVSWPVIARYNDEVWANLTPGSQTIVNSGLWGTNTIALAIVSNQLVIRVGHDIGFENRAYRWIATVNAQFIELATV